MTDNFLKARCHSIFFFFSGARLSLFSWRGIKILDTTRRGVKGQRGEKSPSFVKRHRPETQRDQKGPFGQIKNS